MLSLKIVFQILSKSKLAFSILDPGPSKLPTDLTRYGNDKIAMLGEKYCVGDDSDFKVEDLSSEWESFKHLLSDKYRQESMRAVLKELATSGCTVAEMYPCLSKLACIVLVLPISTAECERCFSAMKRV